MNFSHGDGPEVQDGTMLHIESLFDLSVIGCSFYGVSPNAVANENGIFVSNSRMVQIRNNTFTRMQPSNGSSIVVLQDSRVVRITGNTFSDVRDPVNDLAPDTYRSGNNPAP